MGNCDAVASVILQAQWPMLMRFFQDWPKTRFTIFSSVFQAFKHEVKDLCRRQALPSQRHSVDTASNHQPHSWLLDLVPWPAEVCKPKKSEGIYSLVNSLPDVLLQSIRARYNKARRNLLLVRGHGFHLFLHLPSATRESCMA